MVFIILQKRCNYDCLISKKEFFARIDEARKSIAEGKGTFSEYYFNSPLGM